MITIKQQFIHFLKQNNAYEQYMFNFNHKRRLKINFIQYINNTEPFYLIYNAFNWDRTEEGISTWNKLSKQWVYLLNVPQLFIQFIKQNNVYEQYINQIKYINYIPFIGIHINSIEDIFNYYQPKDYITIIIKALRTYSNANMKNFTFQNSIAFTKWKEINAQWNLLLQKQYDFK